MRVNITDKTEIVIWDENGNIQERFYPDEIRESKEGKGSSSTHVLIFQKPKKR